MGPLATLMGVGWLLGGGAREGDEAPYWLEKGQNSACPTCSAAPACSASIETGPIPVCSFFCGGDGACDEELAPSCVGGKVGWSYGTVVDPGRAALTVADFDDGRPLLDVGGVLQPPAHAAGKRCKAMSWKCTGRVVWGCLGLSWGVWGCLGLSWGVWGCLGLSWGVWGCLGVSAKRCMPMDCLALPAGTFRRAICQPSPSPPPPLPFPPPPLSSPSPQQTVTCVPPPPLTTLPTSSLSVATPSAAAP